MRHIQARSRRLFDRQGRVVRILGVNHDVTELVHTQQRLKTEQCRLSTSLDALLDPHLMLSPVRDDAGSIVDLRIARANPAAVASKRMTRDAFVGSTQLQFWPGHLENGLFDRYRQIPLSGEPLVPGDFEYRRHERLGSARHYDIPAVRVGRG